MDPAVILHAMIQVAEAYQDDDSDLSDEEAEAALADLAEQLGAGGEGKGDV